MGNKDIMNVKIVKIVTFRVVWLHSKQTLRITFPHSVLASSPVTKGVRRTVAVSPSGHVVFCKGAEFQKHFFSVWDIEGSTTRSQTRSPSSPGWQWKKNRLTKTAWGLKKILLRPCLGIIYWKQLFLSLVLKERVWQTILKGANKIQFERVW